VNRLIPDLPAVPIWDSKMHNWKLTPGNYKIIIGRDAIDERLTTSLQFK